MPPTGDPQAGYWGELNGAAGGRQNPWRACNQSLRLSECLPPRTATPLVQGLQWSTWRWSSTACMTPDTTSPGLTRVLPPPKDLEGLPVLSHTHMYTQARTWRGCLYCHTHTCTHRRGPGRTAYIVRHIHVHMIEDLEALPVWHIHVYTRPRTWWDRLCCHTHTYTQAKTGRDHLCCNTQTCTHGGGCHVLSHTVLCVMKRFTLT